MAEGIDSAVATYRRLGDTEADRWNIDEAQLNVLGYQLLQRGMVAEAIAVFELNVEVFPESSNPYDSLGEAYLAAGDRARAIASYRRSLELDPGNANAILTLERLATSAFSTPE